MKLSFNDKLCCFLSVLGVVVGGANANRKLIMAKNDEGIEDQYIVVMKECGGVESKGHNVFGSQGPNAFSQEMAQAIIQDRDAEIGFIYSATICGFSATMSNIEAEKISERDDVAYIEQNAVVTASDITWGIDRIDQRDLPVDNTYEPFNKGSGVDAYIIDTGIYVDHDEFEGRASWGVTYADDEYDNADCNGHGTHVAGTVGGKTYGVAKNVKLIAVKVLNCAGSGSWADVIAGIDWVRKEVAERGNNASTANLSLGGGKIQAVNDAVKRLHESGVVTAVAAGNSNSDAKNYSPASESTVLTVGATSSSDARSSFSNYGEFIDIFAPGSGITAAWIGSPTNTRTISGTSMASPHVCGAAALYLSTGMDAKDVSDFLIASASKDKVGDDKNSPNRLLFLKPPSESPSSSPSPSDSASDSAHFSWDINMIEADDGTSEDGKAFIKVHYESSDRKYRVEVFADDCTSSTDVFSVEEERTDSHKEGYMHVDVDLTIDQEKLEKSSLWEENGNGGFFSFCVLKSLLASDDTAVTRKHTIFRVSVDNQAGFSIGGIAIKEDEFDVEDLSITYAGTVKAFQCEENTYKRVDGTVLGPFDKLNVCVDVDAAESPDTVVNGILDLTITQDDTRLSFIALKNGEPAEDDLHLVSTKCNADGICMARVQLISAFFLDPKVLNVEGVATLGGTSRKLNLPVRTSSSLRGGGNEKRNLQEDEKDDEFTLKVGLTQPCKEGKGATSILRNIIKGQE